MMIRNAMCMGALVLACGVVAWTQEAPKWELTPDYSYARYAPSASYTKGHSFNGGGGRLAFNVNRWLGIGADLQGYNSNTTQFNIPPNSTFPNGFSGSVSGNLFTYLFGPVIKFRGGPVQPFFDVLPGAAHTNVYGNAFKTICQPVAGNCTVSTSPDSNAFALSAGGGLDIPINQRIYIRPGEFDYLYTRFTNQFNNAGQNNFRYLAGLGINMGLPNPKIPSMACAAAPSEVFPWEGPVKGTATPTDFNPKHTLTYDWESSGGTRTEQGNTASVDTASMQPGPYTLKATATDPKQKKNNSATCSASFTVKQPHPPVLTCSASVSTVQPGQPVTITVSGSSPDGSAIDKRHFQASAGKITEGQTTPGSRPSEFTTTATLDTTGVPTGTTIAVNAYATDVHGQTGQCEADEATAAPPPPVVPHTQALCSASFANDSKRPTRVNNEAKACLDQVALSLQQQSDSKLVSVASATSAEKVPPKHHGKSAATVEDIAAQRSVNVKDYLVKDKGIDPSRISAATTATEGQQVQNYLVPAGANFASDVSGTTPVDESTVKPQERKPLPERHHSH